ncbi:MAG: hypothetical protein AB1832_12335 [Pseudomonadota bacterium]
MDTSRFVELAEAHAAFNASGHYSRPSVRRANLVADELRSMMLSAFTDRQETEALFSLLDQPAAGPWIAYCALENLDLAEARKTRCLEIIRARARESTLNGLGAIFWLSQHGYNG